MTNKAGRTVSVRMPEGAIERLKAATGVPFSTLVRWTMMALLEKKDMDRAAVLNNTANEVRDVVAEMPDEVFYGKEEGS